MDLKRDENEAAAQRIYARWLDISTRVAFAVSLAAFLAYATGALAPFVPLEALPALWGLPVDEFLRRTGAPSGWGWLELAARGDYLNLACIALLPLVTALCYLRRCRPCSAATSGCWQRLPQCRCWCWPPPRPVFSSAVDAC